MQLVNLETGCRGLFVLPQVISRHSLEVHFGKSWFIHHFCHEEAAHLHLKESHVDEASTFSGIGVRQMVLHGDHMSASTCPADVSTHRTLNPRQLP